MKTDRINFTGFDARPLKSILVRDVGCGEPFAEMLKEVTAIGNKTGFDVFVQNTEKIMKSDEYALNSKKVFPNEVYYPWAQDNITFTPDGKMLANYFLQTFNNVVEKYFKTPINNLKHHIQGGNFFIVKEKDCNSVIIGREELDYYRPETIKNELCAEKIYPISQPDFHIDMGIRPLKDKVVLVNDEDMVWEVLTKGIESAKEVAPHDVEIRQVQLALENIKEVFEIGRMQNPYKNSQKIFNELESFGFKPVKVPGNFVRPKITWDVDDENHYMMNFMNAIVHEKSDGSLVYITNKSVLDDIAQITPEVEKKIGFSFNKSFKDSVKDYIKEEDIYFINGKGMIPRQLEYSQGGVHCLFVEAPVIK